MTAGAAVSRRSLALALCCAVVGCGGPARPELPEWRNRWERVRALVPSEDAFGSGDAESRCTALLAGIRESHAALLPTPDRALDVAVDAWLGRAEGLAFECPAGAEQRELRRTAFSELAVLEAEIDAGLHRAGSG